jgi:biopolymer transport protein ExbD
LEPALVKITRVGEQVMFQIGMIQTNDLKEIQNVLRDFENKSDGAFVQAAGDVPFEAAAQALGACKASGFGSVSYLTGD